MPPERSVPEDPLVISYRTLRRAVGAIGIALPIALVLGENQFGRSGILDSISSYYWSDAMRDVLVGSLCAIGVFMLSYRGDGWKDNLAGYLTCAFAVGVAMFPCSEPGKPRTLTNYLHYGSAAGMFLTLAYFCIFSFTYNDPGTTPLPKKPLRNKIYVTCGIIILFCIAGIGLHGLLRPNGASGSVVFWLEAAAIWAFGWSWYIKGKGVGPIQG